MKIGKHGTLMLASDGNTLKLEKESVIGKPKWKKQKFFAAEKKLKNGRYVVQQAFRSAEELYTWLTSMKEKGYVSSPANKHRQMVYHQNGKKEFPPFIIQRTFPKMIWLLYTRK